MKQDGPGKILNDTQVSINSEGAGRASTVDSKKSGGALVDVPTTLTVIIRGIAQSIEGDSEIDIFGNRLAMRIKEGGYADVITLVKLEFTDIKEIDFSELQ